MWHFKHKSRPKIWNLHKHNQERWLVFIYLSIYLPSISLKMSSSRIMFFFTVLLIFISTAKLDGDGNGNGGGYGDGVGISTPSTCTKCSICPYPCRSQPPSPSGYHSYGAPPPPSPVAQVNCPPDAPVQCCQQQYAPPTPFYYPYNNYSGSTHFQVIKPYISWWIFGLVTLFRVHQVWRNFSGLYQLVSICN